MMRAWAFGALLVLFSSSDLRAADKVATSAPRARKTKPAAKPTRPARKAAKPAAEAPTPAPEAPTPAPEPPAPAPEPPKPEVAVAVPAPEAAKPRVATVRIGYEWDSRRFLDSEPSSSDKHYVASGFFAWALRADVYPFSERPDALQNAGLFASYGRAIGLGSTDIDTQTDVGTNFYHFDVGLQYRLPFRSAFSLAFSAAYERWVFDFDDAAPVALRELPTARYSLARAGTDARFAIGSLAILGGAELMVPLSIAPLGDREPTGGGFGARARLGIAYDLVPMFTVDLSGAYTLLTFHLPSVPGRNDEPGSVLDQYFVTSLGLTLNL